MSRMIMVQTMDTVCFTLKQDMVSKFVLQVLH